MKLKKSIFGIIVAAVCTLFVFNLVACGKKIQAKILPFTIRLRFIVIWG